MLTPGMWAGGQKMDVLFKTQCVHRKKSGKFCIFTQFVDVDVHGEIACLVSVR